MKRTMKPGRKELTVFCSLALCATTVCFAGNAPAEKTGKSVSPAPAPVQQKGVPRQTFQQNVSAPLVKLSLFKNGMAAALREIRLNEAAHFTRLLGRTDQFLLRTEFCMEDTIRPVHGTVWIDTPDFANLYIRTAIRARGQVNRNPFVNLTASYLGQKISIVCEQGKEAVIITGTVIDTNPRPEGDEEPQHRYPQPYLTAPQPYLTLEKEDGRLVSVPVHRILEIQAKAVNATVQEYSKTLCFQMRDGKIPAAPVKLSYLTKGISWFPSYRMVLGKDKKLHLLMAATITNDLEDFRNAEIRLISGFPNIQFANQLSPLAPGVTLASFLRSLGCGEDSFDKVSPLMRQKTITFNQMDLPAAESDMAGASAYHIAAGSGKPEDVQYYDAGRISMKKGESLHIPLDDAETGYERLVEWTIPARFSGWGARNRGDVRNECWDAIRFQNPFSTAMTTAPAEIVEDGKFLAQTTSFWTNPGQKNLLRITKALTVRCDVLENETARDVVHLYGRRFQKCEVSGTLRARNFRPDPVRMLIKLHYSGKFISAESAPEQSLLPEGVFSVNPSNQLMWTIDLKPGAEISIPYRYSVLASY